MTAEVQVAGRDTVRLPPVPWRDPNLVAPKDLESYIGSLERACAENPHSADLRTCLGMAHAMNFDAYRSMDALEEAIRLEPDNFWARLKYAELWYRLRALERAKAEMIAALDLANSPLEMAVARKHLAEIRRLMREGTQKPEWTRSLTVPVAAMVLMFVAASVLMVIR